MNGALALDVVLIIPDNEALTALATLRRHGLDVANVERADVWRFGLASGADSRTVVEAVRGIETIFNPNKHRLRVRETAPASGEVWIDEPGAPGAFSGPPFRLAGRLVPEVTSVERFVAWRLTDAEHRPVAASVVDRAAETLLCNPAFQRAIR
jgi:hypothetical protein